MRRFTSLKNNICTTPNLHLLWVNPAVQTTSRGFCPASPPGHSHSPPPQLCPCHSPGSAKANVRTPFLHVWLRTCRNQSGVLAYLVRSSMLTLYVRSRGSLKHRHRHSRSVSATADAFAHVLVPSQTRIGVLEGGPKTEAVMLTVHIFTVLNQFA